MYDKLKSRLDYYKRIFPAYLDKESSHLAFFHEKPTVNDNCPYNELGEYYMTFFDKAKYSGPFDSDGVPFLDFKGNVGKQYVPVAIAQYGLGNYNLYERTGESEYLAKATKQAEWLATNLEKNDSNIPVWNFKFDWEYKVKLIAPWYSGLSQGLGISLLARIYRDSNINRYLLCAENAYLPLSLPIEKGGVIYLDNSDNPWIEESIIEPPTHVLNGFLWALWGVWDFYLLTEREEVRRAFNAFKETLKCNLPQYDIGYWSLYELADLRIKMLASPFYHSLHSVQLEITARLTGEEIFQKYAEKWEGYTKKRYNRTRALLEKAIFKMIHY